MNFPPGDISSPKYMRSQWREFAFMLHQLQAAIEPELSLKMILKDWHMIKKSLAELPRKRALQIEEFQKRAK